ncbi:MAG: hypothetical protein ABSA53_05875 [Streptosporangiaceae bacterium]
MQYAVEPYMQRPDRRPHMPLTACAIILSARRGLAQLTGPDDAAALIGQLRAGGTVLTYDRHAGRSVLAVTTRRRSPSARTPLTLTRARTGKGGPPKAKREKEHLPRPEAERG